MCIRVGMKLKKSILWLHKYIFLILINFKILFLCYALRTYFRILNIFMACLYLLMLVFTEYCCFEWIYIINGNFAMAKHSNLNFFHTSNSELCIASATRMRFKKQPLLMPLNFELVSKFSQRTGSWQRVNLHWISIKIN